MGKGLMVEVGGGRQARMRPTTPTNCTPHYSLQDQVPHLQHFIFYRTFFVAHGKPVASHQPTKKQCPTAMVRSNSHCTTSPCLPSTAHVDVAQARRLDLRDKVHCQFPCAH